MATIHHHHSQKNALHEALWLKCLKWTTLFVLFALLVFTRFYGASWGMSALMHPDENNMTYAIMGLSCTAFNMECLNPQFFAYGQLPLYLAYAALQLSRLALPTISLTSQTVALTLRLISAAASVVSGLIFFRLVRREMSFLFAASALAFFVATPVLIQQAHFGTTESLLTMFLLLALYSESLFGQAWWVGLAAATKLSALMFGIVPYTYLTLLKTDRHTLFLNIFRLFMAVLFLCAVTLLFSPQSIIHYKDFWGSFKYESAVATGTLPVFYTKQFAGTVPVLFQFISILPYGLGPVLLILFLVGIVFALFSKNRHIYYYLFVFAVLFGANSYLYSKWTRFIAPTIPFFIFFAVYGLYRVLRLKPVRKYRLYVLTSLVVLQFVWGYMFFSIYLRPDVRHSASEWMTRNIPEGSYVFAESANVVDLPLENISRYRYASVFLNDIDESSERSSAFEASFPMAEYIVVPSRRVFANYTCYREISGEMKKAVNKTCLENEKKYPLINGYYDQLFASGDYELVKKFTSFPKLELGSVTLFEIPDENAEETWSVFDHPVVRIYKRVKR